VTQTVWRILISTKGMTREAILTAILDDERINLIGIVITTTGTETGIIVREVPATTTTVSDHTKPKQRCLSGRLWRPNLDSMLIPKR